MTQNLLGPSLLALLFLLSIATLVTLKLCSAKIDHRATPLFISGWILLGLLAVSPFYGHLLMENLPVFAANPALLGLCALKGFLMCLLLVTSQELMRESLSSRHYVTPLSVGLIAVTNYFLGEHLTGQQWISALGLSALSAGFFFKGHLSDLSRNGKIAYAKLVALSVALSAIDQTALKSLNWFSLLLVTNVVLLAWALAINRGRKEVLKDALLHKSAALAGAVYAATEIVKFYQQVSINPVTAVITVQAVTKPVILVLSALVWKERTVKEQLAWGLSAFVLVVAPHFF
jgi:hypothetical protein